MVDDTEPGHREAPRPSELSDLSAAMWLPDRFEALGAPLGAGATAVVWPVRHLVDGREFGLKVWRRPLSDDAERDRFRREVRRHVALNAISGHIVTYSWADEAPPAGLPWIGMEIHGRSLQQVLDSHRPSWTEGLPLCTDILSGLAAMHRQGLVHRDLKPGNVLIDGGRAKLCDLGLVTGDHTPTDDSAAGTVGYTAPELVSGRASPSPRTDVYSAARTIRETLGPNLPGPLARVLTEAASINPHDRPATAEVFAQRLRRAAADLGQVLPPPLPPSGAAIELPSTPPPGLGSNRRWNRRHALVSVVALLVALVAAASLALRAERPDSESVVSSPPSSLANTVERPDAGRAPADISTNGVPIVLPAAQMGRCPAAVPGARKVQEWPYVVSGTAVAYVASYYSSETAQACAKLIKPDGTPYAGVRTHLALTLCGDGNACDSDWNAYPIDAGPVVVPSHLGCISWRVSMTDESGTEWIVRDDVEWWGCD